MAAWRASGGSVSVRTTRDWLGPRGASSAVADGADGGSIGPRWSGQHSLHAVGWARHATGKARVMRARNAGTRVRKPARPHAVLVILYQL